MIHSDLRRVIGVQGFTLIELLVVIAIIGILATSILASLNTARLKARDARRLADIKQLQNALELYFDSQTPSEYPAANSECTGTKAYGLEALVTTGFMPSISRNPTGVPLANCYFYTAEQDSPRDAYHLGVILEDRAHQALSFDKDCDSTDNDPVCAAGTTYGPSGTQFDGSLPDIYDVTP